MSAKKENLVVDASGANENASDASPMLTVFEDFSPPRNAVAIVDIRRVKTFSEGQYSPKNFKNASVVN